MSNQSMDAKELLAYLNKHPDYTEIHNWPEVQVDLRYASTNNFMGKDVYGEFRRAFLHREAAEKLKKACEYLGTNYPEYRFLVLDALRPRSVQRKLWDHVYCTDEEKYVANPNRGSIHNFGFAIDLTLIDASGDELDMGAGFDDFRPIAEPRHEEKFLQEGSLSATQIQNRLALRRSMEAGGWTPISIEWWHFDAAAGDDVRKNYAIIE